jgi:hypothetical protein
MLYLVTLYLTRALEDKDEEEEEATPVRYLAIEKRYLRVN